MATLTLIRSPIACILALAVLAEHSPAQTDLVTEFRDPPASARPHTWWHWMNGNITAEGITADLEAMKAVGLGGAQIFNVSESIPDGPAPFMSPQWRELLKHAVAEADRLGLELCIHNCAGWSSSGGPWITPEHAMQIVVTSEVNVTGPRVFAEALPRPETRLGFYRDIAVLALPFPANAARIEGIAPKAGYEARYGIEPAAVEYPPGSVLKRDRIVDLTPTLTPDGFIQWQVPPGSWTILRIGHTPTGAVNAPSPVAGRGLECDKLSREAFDAHWDGMMGPIIADLGPLAGKTLNNCLIDSYEVGAQNWTPRFRDEFRQRRGYDPLLLLPVLTGRVVDSGEVSERFLWDLRRTIADLFADNYYTRFAELCRENGMLASIEPYDGPFECLLTGRDADIPMGEFWVGGGESTSCKLAASVAHTYGRTLVGAESFTATPSTGRWQNDPASLKAIGDLIYAQGVNRFIIHRYAHQPWMDKLPGMTMGQWGTHFERTTTWWGQSPAWLTYLSRCQYLLQQGRFVADVCYFAGEAAPNSAPFDPALKALGYDYDACNADVLMNRMSVQDGRLVLPDGMTYRVLMLPDSTFMTPELIARVRDLVNRGATIIGPRPHHSPSLAGYPQSDAVVESAAAELWGVDPRKAHAFGKGRVLPPQPAATALQEMGIDPDCLFTSSAGLPKMAWIHRTVGDTDIYFLSNQKARADDVECSFRIRGRSPDLWNPETGSTEPAPIWSAVGNRTVVPIHFDPAGSVFVVFGPSTNPGDHVVSMTPPPAPGEPAPPKLQVRRAVYEAIDGAGSADVTKAVAAMVDAGETNIPATNAAYGDPAYMHLKRLVIDLTIDGQSITRAVEENGVLELVEPGPTQAAPWTLTRSDEGTIELVAFRSDPHIVTTAAGRTIAIPVPDLPHPLTLSGPWTIHFPPGRGALASIRLDTLVSWTDHPDAGVRYFSGTAEYETHFDIPAGLLGPGKVLRLDLGQVKNLAQVSLNGTDLGVWWRPPFSADVTSAAGPGRNTLKIRITNLWVNRLIGDEQFPDDCEWNGKPIARWPRWMVDGQPRPVSERLTFTTWKHYTKDSPLLESGLLGPVVLQPGARVEVDLSP
jgi:hypothetical protein